GGALLALGLVAVGLLAASPREAPGQPEKPKQSAKANSPAIPDTPAKPVASSPSLPDREALQGLWVAERIDVGRQAEPLAAKEIQQFQAPNKMQILVAGDVWGA